MPTTPFWRSMTTRAVMGSSVLSGMATSCCAASVSPRLKVGRSGWRGGATSPSVAECELRVLGHLVRGPRGGEDHVGHHLLDAGELADELLHLLGDLRADRAGRRGQREGH